MIEKTKTLFDRDLSENELSKNIIVCIKRASEQGLKNTTLDYSFGTTDFGDVILASTEKGISYLAFEKQKYKAFEDLKKRFPMALFQEKNNDFHEIALSAFSKNNIDSKEIKLHLLATDFQFEVWKALLKIPFGETTTYGKIAEIIGKPKASRAVGTAIGSNPVAFIIPCHRVVQISGKIGGYRWGKERKIEILEWERSQYI